LHPTKCVCGNKLPSRKLGRPQFCSDNCRKAHSKWNVRTYGPQRRRNVPKSVTKSDNSRPDFGDLPLSILGPRFPWETKPVDPRGALQAIRHKEMGPIPIHSHDKKSSAAPRSSGRCDRWPRRRVRQRSGDTGPASPQKRGQ
jgi:hypothetical protein